MFGKILIVTFFAFFNVLLVNAQSGNVPLVVGIVINQMRADMLMRYSEYYGSGGFNRLMQGAVCNNASYNYLITESPCGMATIVTGANPSHHGIVGTRWYSTLTGRYQTATGDFVRSAVGSKSLTGKVSPLQMLGTSIGDEMKLNNFKQSKVFAVSSDNYAAVLLGGHIADAVYWFDDREGKFITSDYYMSMLPSWVNAFNDNKLPDDYISRGWFTLRNVNEYRASLPDNSIYEVGFDGKSTFPYNLKQLSINKDYTLLKYTPYGNSIIKDMALSLIENENLGGDGFTDLLMVNFTATGYASDIFGIRSVEVQDIYMRLDMEIATLLSALDANLGRDNYIVFLTADRGASDCPAFLNELGLPGSQINTSNAMTVLGSYLKAIYGYDNLVEKYQSRQVYLNHQLIEEKHLPMDEIQDMASRFLVQFNGIDNAVPASALQQGGNAEGVWQKAQNSCHKARSGDILINLQPGWQEISETYTLSAQSTGFNYDTRVPLIFYGKNIKKCKISRRVCITDIAATVATLLGINFPDYTTGDVINEITD